MTPTELLVADAPRRVRGTSAPAPTRRRGLDPRVVLAGVVGASALYAWLHLDAGWIPHDEGALGHAADRVLAGELPHRDFDDVYTGGLAFLDAAAFRLFGASLWSLRLMLFVAFVGWVATVQYVGSRVLPPLGAAMVTLLAAAWSIPNYPAAMPSWYNLFLATAGIAAVVRFLETGARRWLVAAGVAGGLSFLVKLVGLYYVAGVLLYLVWHARSEDETGGEAGRTAVAYATFVTAALLAFVGVLVGVVRATPGAPELVHFVLPGALVAAFLVHAEWGHRGAASGARFVALARLLVPFLAGVALPVAAFLIPYASTGAIDAFLHGVFVLPSKRLGFATIRMLPVLSMLALLPLAALAALAIRAKRPFPREGALLLACGAAIVLAMTLVDGVYRGVWAAARNLIPVLTLAGLVVVARARPETAEEGRRRAILMLAVSVTAVFGLVQFPFAVPIYFCYVAPLVGLVAAALVGTTRPAAMAIPLVVAGFFTAFAVVRVNGRPLAGMSLGSPPVPPMQELAIDRAGIRVPLFHVAMYEAVVPLLREKARGGVTWASPDAPEIYVLTGLRNPTRSLFEFFEDSTGREQRTLAMLDREGITAVALNAAPQFSPGITPAFHQALVQRYPYYQNAGRFQVRWRE